MTPYKKQITYLMLMILMHLQSAFQAAAQNQPAMNVQFTTSSFPGGYEVSCHNASNGSIEVMVNGGIPPYSYSWSNGANTPQIQNLNAGTYQIQISDAQGQTISESIQLRAPAMLQLFSVNTNYNGYEISSNGGSDGSIDLQSTGGTPPYQYQWSNGSSSEKLVDLPAGNYQVSVMDANACNAQHQVLLQEPPALSGSISLQQAVSCAGAANGMATANVSGGVPPYSYQWEHGGFGAMGTGLQGGQHTVLVNDANGAGIMLSIQVPEPAALSLGSQISSYPNGYAISCYDCFNGSIQVNATGGTPPYQYAWSGTTTAQGPSLQQLGEGNYVLHLTDAAGCLKEESFILSSPEREDWTVGGNTNVSTQNKFIGTTDTSSLAFRTQNIERIKLSGLGGIKIMDTLNLTNYADTAHPGLRPLAIDWAGNVVPFDLQHMIPGIYYATPDCGNVQAWSKQLLITPQGTVAAQNDDIFKCPLEGNVGIGTMTPQAKLDVEGEIAVWGTRLHVGLDNRVGINTDAPAESFDVNGNAMIRESLKTFGTVHHYSNNAYTDVAISNDGANGYIDFHGDIGNPGKLILNGNSNYEIWLDGKTTVAGQLDACRVVVEHSGWCDYVFSEDYKLPGINEVESYIKENKHLPGIPSEETLQKENLDLGKMQKMQMEKIEQLMLYVIELNHKVNALDSENRALKTSRIK